MILHPSHVPQLSRRSSMLLTSLFHVVTVSVRVLKMLSTSTVPGWLPKQILILLHSPVMTSSCGTRVLACCPVSLFTQHKLSAPVETQWRVKTWHCEMYRRESHISKLKLNLLILSISLGYIWPLSLVVAVADQIPQLKTKRKTQLVLSPR
jgi:hypothetical protein